MSSIDVLSRTEGNLTVRDTLDLLAFETLEKYSNYTTNGPGYEFLNKSSAMNLGIFPFINSTGDSFMIADNNSDGKVGSDELLNLFLEISELVAMYEDLKRLDSSCSPWSFQCFDPDVLKLNMNAPLELYPLPDVDPDYCVNENIDFETGAEYETVYAMSASTTNLAIMTGEIAAGSPV